MPLLSGLEPLLQAAKPHHPGLCTCSLLAGPGEVTCEWPVQGSSFQGCVLGINTFVDSGCSLTNCLLMGNDNYNNRKAIEAALQRNEIPIGIGESLRACTALGGVSLLV